MNVQTPKQLFRNKKHSIFPYYAGFSHGFVRDALSCCDYSEGTRVLDPWNGAGTTTHIAQEHCCNAWGYDINPVMVLVAKASLLHENVSKSIRPLTKEIITETKKQPSEVLPNEPLLTWFGPQSASLLRQIAIAIERLFVEQDVSLAESKSFDNVSSLAAFFYVSLFRTARSFIGRFQASNPTWIKSPKDMQNRVRPSSQTIQDAFIQSVEAAEIALSHNAMPSTTSNVLIDIASSDHIPLEDNSIDLVISSPPYCTRIDYAVATKVEYATLGFQVGKSFKAIRQQFIGSPTVGQQTPKIRKEWGPTCASFLRQVDLHQSKASNLYYGKNLRQYFDGIQQSLTEIDRVMTEGGDCFLVVQDSWYKEIHNDLPQSFIEMAHLLNWTTKDRIDFCSAQTMGRINPHANKYRKDCVAPTESVLWFCK